MKKQKTCDELVQWVVKIMLIHISREVGVRIAIQAMSRIEHLNIVSIQER